MQIIENVINTFLSKKCNPPVKSPIIVPKLKKYIKLPFYGPESYKMRNSLILCLKNFCNHVNFRIVLSNPYKIGSFLKFKDKIPPEVQSRVIYEYKCIQFVTNSSFSNICEYAEQENHPLSHSNFKIIRSMPNKTSLLIAESLHIKFNNPSLNNHATSFPLIIADKIWFYVLLFFTLFLCFILIRSYSLTTVYQFFEKFNLNFRYLIIFSLNWRWVKD